jgi:hypothetical protein
MTVIEHEMSAAWRSAIMTVIQHQMYEIGKGVRHLALVTVPEDEARRAMPRVRARGMECFTQPLRAGRVNLVFGQGPCVAVARELLLRGLNAISDEEDFILGALLGYDCRQQCERYLRRKVRNADSSGGEGADAVLAGQLRCRQEARRADDGNQRIE